MREQVAPGDIQRARQEKLRVQAGTVADRLEALHGPGQRFVDPGKLVQRSNTFAYHCGDPQPVQ